MTDSDSEPRTDSKPAPNPLDSLRKIGKYELEVLSGDKHTEGGFCRVYRSQYKTQSSNRQAAIKVSLHAVEDCECDFKARQLLSMLLLLLLRKLSNVAALPCSGLHTRENGRCTRVWLLAGRRIVKTLAFQLCMNVSQTAEDCHTVGLKQSSSQVQTCKQRNVFIGGFVQTDLGTHSWMSMQLLGQWSQLKQLSVPALSGVRL